jgi:anaerobic magnesium-protoporphyrin IX monomethyl ester cyclase
MRTIVWRWQSVPRTIERLVRELTPDVVGLSVMTFQRQTAFKVIALVRALLPSARIVVGGYDPSLATDVYTASQDIDAVVCGEGDVTFRELIRAWERGETGAGIEGLCYRESDGFRRNAPRHVSSLAADVRPPKRTARVLSGYTLLGRSIDVVETSRGCTYDCSFCSIIEMRGRNFHVWPVERVVADIVDARMHGARVIFLVDDNIMLNVERFKSLCHAIIDAGLDDMDFIVQAMTGSIANSGDELAALMRRAGFRYVFLGIENVLDADLDFLKARAKNSRREGGRTTGNATTRACDLLHRHGMFIVGGLIVGSPGDTAASIEANLAFARRYVDWPYIQHPTPYPGTPMTKEFRARGLIVTEAVDEYDGTTAVVRTEHLDAEDVEFMRWRSERWMKVRHLPAVLRHDPGFVSRHVLRMMRHTFRGTTWKTWLGLESQRDAFRRYKTIRRQEREFFPQPACPPAS